MPDMRVTSLELHQKLGQMIDKARFEPVVVTKHDREHVVIVSAEHYAFLLQAARKARLTGSLSPEERALAVAATVPCEAEQERILTEMAAALEANHGGNKKTGMCL
ncbi:MAG: type II toxin-antitoxin system prevent-host-death family antitoxin [Rhodomicrobium sp.]